MEQKYWIVRAEEPYLSISLKKLKIPDNKIKIWLPYIHAKTAINTKFFYVRCNEDGEFAWSKYTKDAQDWYKESKYKYGGTVKVDDYEVDAYKYNL